MKLPFHQTWLYEIHSRIFCSENDCRIGKLGHQFWESDPVQVANQIWLMGIWEMSAGSEKIARSHPGLRDEFKKAKSNLEEDDILSSPYAIYNYNLNPILTSNEEILVFRNQLLENQKQLILDFVPNHMSLDTPLLNSHSECFLKGQVPDKNHFLHSSGEVFAHGRDPYFDGWTDTVQWDFSNIKTLDLHIEILLSIAKLCDGVRCDMAMLALPDVFTATHKKPGIPYWKSLIETVKSQYPNFKFYAEAYWNREYELQTLGFDGTYDKTLYDRLTLKNGESVKAHLNADTNYQSKSIRFIENHDEDRSAKHFGFATLDYFSLLCFLPGIQLYYQDQEKGFKIKLPIQLGKRDREETDHNYFEFYNRVFNALKSRNGSLYRFTPTYHIFGDGDVLVYLLESDLHSELFLWNPMNYEISGKIMLEDKYFPKIDLFDIVGGQTFPAPDSNSQKDGLFFRLTAFKAQWFIF